MTLPSPPQEVSCAVCGLVSEQTSLASTSAFGSPDLDSRPPELKRSTMDYWLERCPHCGYCASTISRSTGTERSLVESPTYQAQRANPAYPPLANAFLCRSMVEEAVDELTEAAWSAIHAAWVCDDAGQAEAASACRRRALRLREAGADGGPGLAQDAETDAAIAADLLRRIGDYESVRGLVSGTLASSTNETIRQILQFQALLASRRDSGCYKLENAVDNTP
jgi:hypothetical protein